MYEMQAMTPEELATVEGGNVRRWRSERVAESIARSLGMPDLATEIQYLETDHRATMPESLIAFGR